METLTGKFFEIGVKFDKTQEDGKIKKVMENYVVDALTFTEGEKKITEEMSQYISGEFDVVKMKPTPYVAILTREGSDDDRFWTCKIVYTFIDECTAKEKKTKESYLVQSLNVSSAIRILEDYMKGNMGDWEIVQVTETNIVDIVRYNRIKS